jgi:hypothetical protein
VREACSEVLAVRAWHEHVQLALPEPHLGRHVGELEAPGGRECEVVVHPAAASLADGLDERVSGHRPDLGAGQHGLVGGGELRGERVEKLLRLAPDRLDLRIEEAVIVSRPSSAAPNSFTFTSAIPHEVETWVVGGRGAHEDGGAGDAIREECGTCERVRPSARCAHEAEALEPEVIGQGLRTCGASGTVPKLRERCRCTSSCA